MYKYISCFLTFTNHIISHTGTQLLILYMNLLVQDKLFKG